MSQLNQIIASLLSDINEAKSKADEASRSLAQTYASDEILRYFPVPKIGIQNLEIELKYAIESVEEKPASSSQSKLRLATLLDSFSSQLAKEIKIEVAKSIQTNELYAKLGSEYPSKEWEENLTSLIKESFSKANNLEEDPAKSLKLVGESITKSYSDFFPQAFKSDSLGIIPVESGNYQIVGLDSVGKIDFTVNKSYSSDSEAMADAKTLNSAISAKKIEVVEAKRESGTKLDMAKLKAGNQEFSVVIDSQKVGSVQPKVFFENTFKEKNVALNTPVRTLPTWVAGRPAISTGGVASRPSASSPSSLKEDQTLKSISDNLIQKKLPELVGAISKINKESKVTTLQVTVEADKLKQLKPETMATIKFSLNGNDFTLLQEDGQTSIL